MLKTIDFFQWTKGSINDNIRKILIENHIGYYNTMNGDIFTTGDNRRVIAERTENDIYTVSIIF